MYDEIKAKLHNALINSDLTSSHADKFKSFVPDSTDVSFGGHESVFILDAAFVKGLDEKQLKKIFDDVLNQQIPIDPLMSNDAYVEVDNHQAIFHVSSTIINKYQDAFKSEATAESIKLNTRDPVRAAAHIVRTILQNALYPVEPQMKILSALEQASNYIDSGNSPSNLSDEIKKILTSKNARPELHQDMSNHFGFGYGDTIQLEKALNTIAGAIQAEQGHAH